MGLFDGRSYSYTKGRSHSAYGLGNNSHSSSGHHHQQQQRKSSPARSTHSTSAKQGYFVRPVQHRSSSSSFFNFGGNSSSSHNHNHNSSSYSSSRGIFGGFGGGGGSSYYKRSPRQGYVSYLVNKLRRMLRDLWAYARRHPVKAFFAVVVPLLSAGGAVHGLLRQFGVRVPFMDGGSRSLSGGYYGSAGYGGGSGFGGGGAGGLMENAGSLMQIAKTFM